MMKSVPVVENKCNFNWIGLRSLCPFYLAYLCESFVIFFIYIDSQQKNWSTQRDKRLVSDVVVVELIEEEI